MCTKANVGEAGEEGQMTCLRLQQTKELKGHKVTLDTLQGMLQSSD